MMKTTRHSLLAKGIMVLLSLLVLIFLFTYAWFVDPATPVNANGMTFSTKAGADFDVAIGFETPYTAGEYLVSDFTNANNGSIDFENITIHSQVKGGPSNNVTLVTNTSTSDTLGAINLLRDFKAVDLTGSGYTLYRPTMLMKNGYRYIDGTSTVVDKNITDNKQYIAFDLYVRSESPGMDISLDVGSYVVSAAEVAAAESTPSAYANLTDLKSAISAGTVTVSADDIDNTKLKGSGVIRKSDYGNFSEDSVVGAVRISFTQYKNCNTYTQLFTRLAANPGENDYQLDPSKSKVWIPRSDICLQDTAQKNNWYLMTDNDTSGTPSWTSNANFIHQFDYLNYGTTKTYEDAASQHWYYDETKFYNNGSPTPAASRYTQVTGALTTLGDLDDSCILTISTDRDLYDGKYYYGKCRVNLWIEGCDAEARKAIDGGSFFFGFDLTGH